MLDSEFWENYYTLRKHSPKMAREYHYLARRRDRIDRMNARWMGRAKAFKEEIMVADFQLSMEMFEEEMREDED